MADLLRIKELLKERSITSKEFAEKLGMAPQYLSNIINGGKGASLSMLAKMADALGVQIGDLFYTSKPDSNTIICPHCNKPILIKAEKKQEI